MKEYDLNLPKPQFLKKLKLAVFDVGMTVLFIAFVIAYVLKELRGLF
jgi:hypothetical protein